MKKIIVLIILFPSLVFGNSNFLKKLVDNGYLDVAVDYCQNNFIQQSIQKECVSILKKNKKYFILIELLNKLKKTPDNLLLQYECYIKAENFLKADTVKNELKKYILSDNQENKLNQLTKLKKALIYYNNYNFSKAYQYFSQIKNLDVDEIKKKIMCLIYLNNINKAELEIKKYKIKDFFLNGLIKYKKGEYNQALIFFKNSNNNEARIYIYNCLIYTGKLNEAKNYFSEKNQQKESFIKKIKILIEYEKYDEALLRLDNYKDCYEKFFYSALIFLKTKRYKSAVEYFLKAKKIINSTKVNYYIGLTFFKNNEYTNSIKYLQDAINIQDSYEYYLKSIKLIAQSNYNIGNFNKAIFYYNKILEFPNELTDISNIYLNIGKCFEKLSNYLRAIDYYNKYFELTKDKNILLKIAKLAELKKDYSYSLQIYENFLPIKERKNSFIIENIANIYFKNEQYDESIKFYKKYLYFNKKEFQRINLKIGLCYLYKNDLINAKKTFLKIIESQKKSKFRDEALYWTGLIYFKENNYLKAIIYFQRLYNSNPSSYLTNQAIKYILICAIKQNDFETFRKFIKIYNYPEEIVKISTNEIKKFCKTKKCLQLLTLEPEEEKKFKIFQKIDKLIAQNKLKELKKISKDINNPIVCFKIANFLIDKGLENEAIFYFNKFLNLNSNNINFEDVKKSLNFVINYFFKNKNFQQIVYLTEKFKNIPLQLNCVYYVGVSYYNLKLSQKAKEFFIEYIKKYDQKKGNLRYLFDSAFKLENLNAQDEALSGYLKFIEYSNDRSLKVEALYWVGDIFFKKGELSKALETFLKIKLLYKEFSKWSIQATFRAGNIFEKLGKKENALKEYKYIYYMLPKNDPRRIYISKKLKAMENEKNR